MCISDSRFFNAILFYGTASKILPPDMFAKVVYGCYTKDNIDASAYAPLATAAWRFVWSPPNLCYRWKPIIRHLISLEANLHQGFFRDEKTTILDDLMNRSAGPFESRSVAQVWLNVLMESGIDVMKYLRIEYQLHFDPSTALPMIHEISEFDYRRRYLNISLETPSVSWDWFIDPEGQAYDVLEEFKDFGGFRPPPGSAFLPFNELWPVVFSRWQWLAEDLQFVCGDRDYIILVQRANRFERRCEKKAMKLAKAQGIFHKGTKMPGAWID